MKCSHVSVRVGGVRLNTDKAVVHSEEGHLTGLVQQVGKSYEGVGRVQVQDEHRGDERHSLHLRTETEKCPLVEQKRTEPFVSVSQCLLTIRNGVYGQTSLHVSGGLGSAQEVTLIF